MPITPGSVPEEKEEANPQPEPPALEVETPEQLLERLKRELAQHESNIGSLTKERDNLKGNVETLSKTVDEIKKAAAAYGPMRPDLDAAARKLFTHYEAEVKGVEANLGAKKQKVLDSIGTVDAAIKQQKEQVVPEAEKRASKAAREADEAKAAAEQAQKKYDAVKALPKTLGDNVKKLKDLEDKAEAFDRQTKSASEYVALLEQKKVFGETLVPTTDPNDEEHLPTPEQYAKMLSDAARELDAARVVERDKKQAADAAAADLKREQAALKALEDNRVADILKAAEPLN